MLGSLFSAVLKTAALPITILHDTIHLLEDKPSSTKDVLLSIKEDLDNVL